ncbi:Scarecrow-like protein 32 [Sesamum angolense]|uniref:Scarecrow-like protein 32 n=1 Tax=Sesamum angolense TaxID=2727404 RepID=A0AAE1WEU6_9LAMI|nr:Scarecrow-like protein 32 [Sesamum angolense]
MKAELRGNSQSIPLQNPNHFTTTQSSISGALTGCLSTLDGACIEKLLLHCASALETNDVTLAQQVMWVLNNVASSVGDPNQRLASYFLRALVSRASRVCPTPVNFNTATGGGAGGGPAFHRRLMSVTELAGPKVPPLLNASIEEIGHRLANFAKYRDVPFEFNIVEVGIPQESSSDILHYDLLLRQLNPSQLNLRVDEALVVNCQNWLRYLPDEQMGSSTSSNLISCRDSFLDMVKNLSPRIVTVVDEDCDLGATTGLASRITSCFNYMWIPFDALETFLPKNSPQRIEYEADIGHKIENIIGFEGIQRMERLESFTKLSQRMGDKGFLSVPFCEETVKEVKTLLAEHASGWGMKKDEDNTLILTWKGHNSVYATVWVPHAVETWENSMSN